MEYAVARTCAEATGLRDAVSEVLEAVCSGVGWQLAAPWLHRLNADAGVLHCLQVWHQPSLPLAHQFEAGCLQYQLQPGEGLPGRVWSGGFAELDPGGTCRPQL
ncbi:MAG: hypothetical protein ACRDGF_04965, partial [Chloroflexota bacterium]